MVGDGDAVGTDGKGVGKKIEGKNSFGFKDDRTGFSGKILEFGWWEN